MKSEQREQLRLKIKKLKYKIDKEERINLQTKKNIQKLKTLTQKHNVQHIFKKISFMLQMKGLTITDWIGCCSYQTYVDMNILIEILELMRIRLLDGQKRTLNHSVDADMFQDKGLQRFKEFIQNYGIRV